MHSQRIHPEKPPTLRDLWLRYLEEVDEKLNETPRELLQVPEIQEAIHLAEEASYSKGELQAYDDYWDAISRVKSGLHDAHEAGIEKGIERGIEIGVEKGREEERIASARRIEEERKETAQKMKALSLSNEIIQKATGLSLEDIEKI